MRTYFISALTVMTLALLAPATASAGTHWKCMGFAVACTPSPYARQAKRYDRGYRETRRYTKRSTSRRERRQVAAYTPPKKSTQAAPAQKPARVASSGKLQSGMASYYGTESGSQTASGARFNPSAMTAAHRSLPFGTRVKVTNKRNGRSVVVTINDRGPFIRGRIIDLSTGAAGVIGMRSSGVAPVTVEVLG